MHTAEQGIEGILAVVNNWRHPNHRIHRIAVPVVAGRRWEEQVMAAGPNTLPDSLLMDARVSYPPLEASGTENVALLCVKRTVMDSVIRSIAGAAAALPASPQAIFAIGEHYPDLNKELGTSFVQVVTLDPFQSVLGNRVPIVWWNYGRRGAHHRAANSTYQDTFWFAFKEKA